MNAAHTREEKASDAFLVLGSQYFVHARYSIEQFELRRALPKPFQPSNP